MTVPPPAQIAARVAPRRGAAAAARSTPGGRRISRKAAQQIQELATTPADVDAAIAHPHSTEPTHQDNGTLYVRGDLGVIVPDDDLTLIVGLVRVDPDTAPLRRGRRAGGGHRKATHPAHPGVVITVPHTPSDSRSYPNLVADIRRLTGIDITQPAP